MSRDSPRPLDTFKRTCIWLCCHHTIYHITAHSPYHITPLLRVTKDGADMFNRWVDAFKRAPALFFEDYISSIALPSRTQEGLHSFAGSYSLHCGLEQSLIVSHTIYSCTVMLSAYLPDIISIEKIQTVGWKWFEFGSLHSCTLFVLHHEP